MINARQAEFTVHTNPVSLMKKFPPLTKWFDVRLNVLNGYGYTRHDLRLKDGLSTLDLENFSDELALLIARFRLTEPEYSEWLKYWKTPKPIPLNLKKRFQFRFWRSFVSSRRSDPTSGKICPDKTALQGHIGEVMMYLIQLQYSNRLILTVPRRPKDYSKDSGIDCLELCGVTTKPRTLRYIVWESKAIMSSSLGKYPGKIYDQHLYMTPKSFKELVDQLADMCQDEPSLSRFVGKMVDDFFSRRPTTKKCFGGCVSYSGRKFAPPTAFSGFSVRFASELASDPNCRQVRLCALGELSTITDKVWDKVWSKLLP